MSGIIHALLASYKSIANAAFPLSGLAVYWKLNEASGNANDSVGNTTLTNTGSVTYGTGKINNGAIGTNTTGGYLKISEALGFTAASTQTWNFWYKSGASMSNGYILDNISSTGDNKRLIVYEQSSVSKLHIFANGNEVLTGALSLATWYMITITKNNTSWEVFVNGSSVGTTTTGGLTYSGGAGFSLVNGLYTGGTQTTCSVDEVGIWNRALSASEITALYNSGSGLALPTSSSVLVYAFGGYSGSYQSINDVYDNISNSWTSKTAMTVAKRGQSSVGLGLFAYALGGTTGSVVNTNYEYSQAGNSWSTKTAMTLAKFNMSGGAVGSDKIYCIAGSDTVSNLTSNYEFSQSGNSWVTKTASTQASGGLGNGASIGTDKMYQSCGYVAAPSNVHIEYSQSGNSWATKTVRSDSRYDGGFSNVLSSNFAYYNGGWTGSVLSTVNMQYSQSGNSWASKTAALSQRYWLGSTAVDYDKFSVIAGGDGGTTYYNTMYTYSEASNAWSTRTALGTSRADFQGATI